MLDVLDKLLDNDCVFVDDFVCAYVNTVAVGLTMLNYILSKWFRLFWEAKRCLFLNSTTDV